MNKNNDAIFSDCRKYRYALWRVWDLSKPKLMIIGLNPSTANEVSDDPTIRRVKSMAKNLGYGGVYMMNLFAIVSSDPKVLRSEGLDLIGENDSWLTNISGICQDIVFAWGNFKEAIERGKEVSKMFPNAKAFHINKNGSPKHPLYIKSDVVPVCYT